MRSLVVRATPFAILFFSRLFSLFLIITLTFILMKALPGDPFHEEQALPEQIHKSLRLHYGLEDPFYLQYLRYLKSVFSWSFGPSFRYQNLTVNHIINESFPISALLGMEALLFGVSLGLLLGSISALRQGQWEEKAIFIFCALFLSFPSFLLGSCLQFFLGLKLELFPLARWGTFSQSILPALSLAMLPCAFIARLMFASLKDVMKQNYIRTAKAKGLNTTKVLFQHGLRNALLPLVNYFGPLAANILVGSFVIEKIYAIPGLGQWFINSILQRDYTVIMGLTVFYSLILLTLVLCMDLLALWIDPRIGKRN